MISFRHLDKQSDAAWAVENKANGKYDGHLTDEILVKQAASAMPTIDEFVSVSKRMVTLT